MGESYSGIHALADFIRDVTKYQHTPLQCLKCCTTLLQLVYRLHGLSDAIISDRDRIFTSALWQELFNLSDTQLLMSSSYHPQTDGQTERLNECLEAFLRCGVHSCPKQWHKWIPLDEYWYTTSDHTALGLTPFEVLYGHPPWHFGILNPQIARLQIWHPG